MCTSTALVADALPVQPASVIALSTAFKSKVVTSVPLVALHVDAAAAGVAPTAAVPATAIASSPAPTRRHTDAPAVPMVPPWFMHQHHDHEHQQHDHEEVLNFCRPSVVDPTLLDVGS